MTLKKITKLTSIAVVLLLISACSQVDSQGPTIDIIAPTESMYPIGATVPIQLQVEDDEMLESIHIHITNEANDEMLMMVWSEIDQDMLMIDTSFVANLSGVMMTNFIIEVEAKDVEGNKAEAIKTVHIMDM